MKKSVNNKQSSYYYKEFDANEAFKTLRTNLVLSLNDDDCNVLTVTSANPSEGKSTTSANLAMSLSELGLNVLLIDADLRKPSIHKHFNDKAYPGLTNVIGNTLSIDQAIKKTKFKNLSLLTAGVLVMNPTEALASLAMSKLLKSLKQKYHYIIIDTPPINIMSDALALIQQSSGTILVVKEGSTKHVDIHKSIKKIEFINGKILGFVLNASNENSHFGNYYYYGKYK